MDSSPAAAERPCNNKTATGRSRDTAQDQRLIPKQRQSDFRASLICENLY